MPITQKETRLVQFRVSKEIARELIAGMAAEGDISLAAFCRRVVTQHVRGRRERAIHGKK